MVLDLTKAFMQIAMQKFGDRSSNLLRRSPTPRVSTLADDVAGHDAGGA
jgi:hypothetical protein